MRILTVIGARPQFIRSAPAVAAAGEIRILDGLGEVIAKSKLKMVT